MFQDHRMSGPHQQLCSIHNGTTLHAAALMVYASLFV